MVLGPGFTDGAQAAMAMAMLKDCARRNDLGMGIAVYAEIARSGHDSDLFVCSSLVDMYAKCGLLRIAKEVFDRVPARDTVLWNTLLAGLAQRGHSANASEGYEQMLVEGFLPDEVTFLCVLKACGALRALRKGQVLHIQIAAQIPSFERECGDVNVGNALIDMYMKCRSLVEAHEVFNTLSFRGLVSWNARISGCVKHGFAREALACFDKMRIEGVLPDAITFTCILKACGTSSRDGNRGPEIHTELHMLGLLGGDLVVGNALVDMYAKCGLLERAQQVFDSLPTKDAVSWTSLISGYAIHGQGEQALSCYELMGSHGITADDVALLCALKACSSIGDAVKGRGIHAEIARKGLLNRDLVGNTLVDMYAKCGLILKAHEVFDKLLVQDVVSWNALIGGYADHGRDEDALDLFYQMQNKGIARDAVTFVCALKACGMTGASNKGREIHDEIARNQLLKEDFLLANALIDMYAKCGEFQKAQEVFDEHPNRNSATWNGLIVGYVKHGLYKEALDCFDEMRRHGVSPDVATFVTSLKACSSAGFLEKGCDIHTHIVNEGLLGEEPIIGNVLVDMYSSRCDSLQKAQEVFDTLVFRDVVTWTALIAGYARHGQVERAFDLYQMMRRDGIFPNEVTFVCMLAICGSIGAPYTGQEVHNELARQGYESDPIVGNSLIDMYANCGLLDSAKQVFDKLSVRSVVSWSALISGSALLSGVDDAFLLFDRMIEEGQNPNSITFISILNACSHEGLVDEGQMCFRTVSDECGIDLTLEHYSCLIDLLGRSGQLDSAVSVVERMPFHPNIILWHTMMGACRKWADANRGKQAFHHVVEYNEEDAPAYISLSNMYAEGVMEEDLSLVDDIISRFGCFCYTTGFLRGRHGGIHSR